MSPTFATPAANAPDIDHGHELFDGARGTRLYEQWWRPTGAPPKAVVAVVHGLKDHGSRYDELATRLVAHGFAVHALDLRGHAHSEGPRVEIDSMADFLDDLDAFLARVRAKEAGTPLFLFGHSMGGAIVTRYTLERKPDLAGLVTHGAAFKLDAPAIQLAVLKLVAAIAPRAPIFQLKLDDFSRDPEVVRAAKADPLIHHPPARIHIARELLDNSDRIDAGAEALTVPLLVLHGTADKLTSPKGSEEVFRKAGATDKTLKLYPGLYHDLVHEPEKETVLADIVSWLDARATAPLRAVK